MPALRRRGSLRWLVDVWIWLGQDIQGGLRASKGGFQIAFAQNRALCTVPIGNLLRIEDGQSDRSCVHKSTAVTVFSLQAVVARCLQAPMSANTGFYGVSLCLAACEVTRRLQAAFVTASNVDE